MVPDVVRKRYDYFRVKRMHDAVSSQVLDHYGTFPFERWSLPLETLRAAHVIRRLAMPRPKHSLQLFQECLCWDFQPQNSMTGPVENNHTEEHGRTVVMNPLPMCWLSSGFPGDEASEMNHDTKRHQTINWPAANHFLPPASHPNNWPISSATLGSCGMPRSPVFSTSVDKRNKTCASLPSNYFLESCWVKATRTNKESKLPTYCYILQTSRQKNIYSYYSWVIFILVVHCSVVLDAKLLINDFIQQLAVWSDW